MKIAIVSTHRSWTQESEAWARYHLSLGFTRIYVFADDGCAHDIPPGCAVDLTPCTHGYWLSHSPTPQFAGYLGDIQRDQGTAQWGSPERVMQRQILNACTAMERALADGIDWMLHIDDDEYFWCPNTSIREHFQALQVAGIERALYWNHEAVLPGEDVSPQKRRQTIFKKHPRALSAAQREAIPRALPGKPYFVSHMSGKGAARVLPGTLPSDVHLFYVDGPFHGEGMFKVPGVLHQPYRNVQHFCEKHLSQGEFSTERVFGRPWTPPGVYEEAQRLCRDRNVEGLRSLYSRAVTLSEAELDRLEAEGYLLVPAVSLPIHAEPAQFRGLSD